MNKLIKNSLIGLGLLTATEVIIGTADWNLVKDLKEADPIFQVAGSVGYLNIESRNARCTAFVVDDDKILTNEHCVGNDEDAKGVELYLDYIDPTQSISEVYSCGELVTVNKELDFALLKCAKKFDDKVKIKLATQQPVDGEEVHMIHQQCDYFSEDCEPIKVWQECNIETTIGNNFIHYCDSLGGSSGAPIVRIEEVELDDGLVVTEATLLGLHNIGIGGNGNGRGTANRAVHAYKINEVLKEYIAEPNGQDEPTDEPDPKIGFYKGSCKNLSDFINYLIRYILY